MDAIRQDFDLPTNADFSEELHFTVDGITGIDVNSHVFEMAARPAPGSAQSISLLTVASPVEGFYPVEPDNGYVQMRIDKETLATVFASLNPSVFVGNELRLYYDIVVTLPSGDDEVWLFGYLVVTKGITNV